MTDKELKEATAGELASMVSDASLPSYMRERALGTLIKKGNMYALKELAALVRDTSLPSYMRERAQDAIGNIDEE